MSVPPKLHQRDLVVLNVNDEVFEDHPVLIISCEAANCLEDGRQNVKDRGRRYVGVMMTSSSNGGALFSCNVESQMFESPLSKPNSHFRTNLIISFYHDEVARFINRMKITHFKNVIDRITLHTLSIDK